MKFSLAFCLRAVVFWAGAGANLTAPNVAAQTVEPIRLGMIEAFSGPFANTGEAVARNLRFAIERVNARGGAKLPGGARPLQLQTFDSKGQVEEALVMFRRAVDEKVPIVLQGNSSAVAAALIDTIDKWNARMPGERVLFLNYSAVDPALTNERCTFWHFRFDAHVEMRMAALVEAVAADKSVAAVYLLNQDYSFGQQVAANARSMLGERAPRVAIVGDELHPVGRIRDFSPYIAKIKASGADTVLTGNWGNDLTLLVRAARDAGLAVNFYTFYGNGLGAPAAIGEAGVGRVRAVAEWHPNATPVSMELVYLAFRARFPDPRDDYFQARTVVMIEMLVRAIEGAGSTDAVAVARALEGMRYGPDEGSPLGPVLMRAADHQLIAPLVVSVMARQGSPEVRFDVEGSGFGFRTDLRVAPERTERPSRCRMPAPG
jgi:branched-chain amino acid transport system substrate-binding protein